MGCETSFAAVLNGTAFCEHSSTDQGAKREAFINCLVQRICKNKVALVGQDCTELDVGLIRLIGALLWAAGEAKFAPKPAGASCGSPDWPCSAECANGNCNNGVCCEKQMVVPAGFECPGSEAGTGCPLDCKPDHSCTTINWLTGKKICCQSSNVAQGEKIPVDCEFCGTGTKGEPMEKSCQGSKCACCRKEGPTHGESGPYMWLCPPKGKKNEADQVVGASGKPAWNYSSLSSQWCQSEAPLGYVKDYLDNILYKGTPTLVGKDFYGFVPTVLGLDAPGGSSLKPCGADGAWGCGNCPAGETCIKMMRGPNGKKWMPMTPEEWADQGCVQNPSACFTACVCGKPSLGKVKC